MSSFLCENATGENKEMLIDLGYLKDSDTQERHQMLRAFGIGKQNFCCDIMARLIMKCPKSKVKSLFDAFPIEEGSTYWQTTHHWLSNPSNIINKQ